MTNNRHQDGIADVSGCTSWNQNANDNNCVSAATAVCGAPSKCRCDAVLNIAGLQTCLNSQAPCANATDVTSSCTATQFRHVVFVCCALWLNSHSLWFSARVRVTTPPLTVSTVFPAGAETTGFLYYNFQTSPAQTYAIGFFPPGTPVNANTPAIPRTDLLAPCQVQRQITCGSTTSCVSIVETQLVPRLFHELGDAPCAGTVCTGATRNPTACTRGYTKAGTTTGQQIRFVWVTADLRTPCAAEAADGTFWELFSNTVPTPGVTLGPANTLNGTSVPFNFAPASTCTFPRCTMNVELVVVIDEQIALSWPGYQNILTFVGNLIQTFTDSPLTRFGIFFTGSSNSTSPPLILMQNTATPNLVSNVVLPHLKTNTTTTNFATALTAALNKFWPSGAAPTGARREVLTILGGPDAGSSYTALQQLLTDRNVEAWAIGVYVGVESCGQGRSH